MNQKTIDLVILKILRELISIANDHNKPDPMLTKQIESMDAAAIQIKLNGE